jgi:hypothetical protein
VTLKEYLDTTLPPPIPHSYQDIIKDIILISGGHLGIFSTCGMILDDLIKKSKQHISFSTWRINGYNEILNSMKSRPSFIGIVNQINASKLFNYLKSQNLLYIDRKEPTWVISDQSIVSVLIDIGLLRQIPNSNDYTFTSPFLHDFVATLCSDYKIENTILPQIPADSELAINRIIDTAINFMDLNYITTNYQVKRPNEAAFQVEFYGIVKDILKKIGHYYPQIEGHPGKTRMRYDMVITNKFKWVIELKVNYNTNHQQLKAISQVVKYAKLIRATRPIVVNFSDRSVEEIDLEAYEEDYMETEVDVKTEGVLLVNVIFSSGFTKIESIEFKDVIEWLNIK